MNILSREQVEESLLVQDGYNRTWAYLLSAYGKLVDGQRVIDPADVIDKYMAVTKDGSITYLGLLKEPGLLSASDVAMICRGGWEGFACGGSAYVDESGSIFVKVNL